MVAFLIQLLLAIRSWFARRARLETENLILRQQFIVLCRQLSLLKTLKEAKSLEFWEGRS